MSTIRGSIKWQTLQQVARGVAGMIVAAVIARAVGERGLGLLDSTLALVSIVSGFGGLGMQRIVTRELCIGSTENRVTIGTSLVLSLIACLAGVLFVIWSVRGANPEGKLVAYFACSLIAIVPLGSLVSSIFEARSRLDLIGKLLLCGLVISATARIILALSGSPLHWFALAYSLDLTVACGLGLVMAKSLFPELLEGWRFRFSSAKSLLRESMPILLSTMAGFMYGSMDLIMLKEMASLEEAGLYGAAIRISQIPLFLPGVLLTSFTARLMLSYNDHGGFRAENLRQLTRLLIGLAACVLTGGIIFGPLAVRILYGQSFSEAGLILQIHVIGVAFLILGSLRNHLLILEKKGHYLLICDISGAVTNLLLNYLLIPKYGALGAAFATAVSYCVAFFLINMVHPELRKYNSFMFSAFRKSPI
jgi:polysaccharide transporter, PST family